MRRLSIILLILIELGAFVSCSRDTFTEETQRIEALENRLQMSDLGTKVVDDEALLADAAELGERYVKFADQYPDAVETPEYLYRAGELYYHDLNDLPTAIHLLERNYQEYPNHETAPHAMFLIAYLYHNVQKNLIKAQEMYNTFLNTYPDHQMAAAARFEIRQLGVPDQEILNNISSQEED